MLKKGLILLLFTLPLLAEPWVLVTHPQSPIQTLTKSQVKMIYLKQRRYWEGTKLEALNLPPSNLLRQAFEKSVLTLRPTQIKQHWMKQHYKGYRPPYRVESVASVLLFVKKVVGALGYIPLSKVTGDVKVIYKGQES